MAKTKRALIYCGSAAIVLLGVGLAGKHGYELQSGAEPGGFVRPPVAEADKNDKPGEAQEFYLSKRSPDGKSAIPVARYLVARKSMRDMPHYSTVSAAYLPSDAAHETSSMADFASPWTYLGPGNIGGAHVPS